MDKKYVYRSIILHIAIVLLCVVDMSFLSGVKEFDEQPPIIVDLNDVKISDMTNIPEKAIRGEERKVATRKDNPLTENASAMSKPSVKNDEIKEKTPEPEPIEEKIEIKSPSLVEDVLKAEDSKDEPKKKSDEPKKSKKKHAPIPQRKPQVKPNPKAEPKKKPVAKNNNTTPPTKKKTAVVKNANPLESLMNSVDDLQKQIGEEDAPATIPYDEPVNNMGIEGGNSEGSYFSELSVSGIDFVKSKIQESWKTIAGGKDDRNIEVVINVKLTKEGLIQSVSIDDMRRYRSDTYFQALADSAERAIHIAQEVHSVFKVLASQNGASYSDWKEIRFTFTPLGLAK